jgi:hypothetical protein
MDEDAPPAPTVPASVVAAAVNGPVQVISAKKNIQTHLAMHPGFCTRSRSQSMLFVLMCLVWITPQVTQTCCGSSHSLAVLSESCGAFL